MHSDKDCIYEDARNCAVGGNESFFKIYRQCKYLRENGYPEHNGLYENNLIFRKHNDQLVIGLCEKWWAEYHKFCNRDQLTLCYVFWKNNFQPSLLLPKEENTWNKTHFNRVLHDYSFMYHVKRRVRHILGTFLFKIYPF